MVHALEEIRRVLAPGGILIDLRPLEDSWSVEVVSGAGWQAAGRLSDMPIGLADDAAANQAMDDAGARGWYFKERESEFGFFYYWDTPSEMKKFMDEEWADFEKMEDDVYRRAAALWAKSNADARVRVQVKMRIAVWRKNG